MAELKIYEGVRFVYGDSEPIAFDPRWEDWLKKRADIRNTAIERCARVAETARLVVDHFDGAVGMCKTVDARISIAAAIRALKDKP